MRLDIAPLHLATDPMREESAFLVLVRELPDCRNVAIDQPRIATIGRLPDRATRASTAAVDDRGLAVRNRW